MKRKQPADGLRQKVVVNSYLIVQTMMWGLSFIVTKNITAQMSMTAFLAIRFLLAALVILPFSAHRLKAVLSPTFIRASFVLGGLLAVSMALQVYGLNYTSVTNSSFITSTTVLIVPICERLLFKKKLSPALWMGCIVAFAGVAVLSGGLTLRPNIGDVLTALCAIGFSLQILFTAKYAAEQSADLLGFMQISISAVLFTALWGADGFTLDGLSLALIPGIIFMAIINTCVGFIGMSIALKYIRPTVATLIFALEPIFATVFALVIPSVSGNYEVLTLKTMLGALVVLTGVSIALINSFLPGRRAA